MGRLSVVNQPKSLSELVELAIRKRDASGLGLSQLATKNGYHLTATTINQIRQGIYKSRPRAATIRAIAWLAGVNDEVAFTAAGQPVPGPPFAEELPPGVDNLPPKARKVAIDMLRVLVDMNGVPDEERSEALSAQREADRERLAKLRREVKERRNTVPGQKISGGNVVPLDDDAIDRLHQAGHYDLAAKPAHGGIAHDEDAEDT